MAASIDATVVNFGPGFGRQAMPSSSSVVINVAEGIRPEDVLLVSDGEQITSIGHYSNTLAWAWELRLKDGSDAIRQVMSVQTSQSPLPLDGAPVGYASSGAFMPAGTFSIEFADGTVWLAQDVFAKLHEAAHTNSSQLLGSSQPDRLVGDGRNLSLYGFGGDDVLVSSTGDEVMSGGSGVNEYRFSADMGRDTIFGNWASDKIVMGEGIAASDVHVRRSGPSLYLQIGGSTKNTLMVSDVTAMVDELLAGTGVIQFADGTVWTMPDLFRQYFQAGTDGADSLIGSAGAQCLSGGAGDDVINGRSGADSLVGGAGDDSLNAGYESVLLDPGAGNDTMTLNAVTAQSPLLTIRFGRGGGQDVIQNVNENVGPANIAFDADVRATDVSIYKVPASGGYQQDVVLRIKDSGDSLVLKGIPISPTQAIPLTMSFGDGVTWSLADVLDGTVASTTLRTYADVVGTAGADTLVSGSGSGNLNGGGGADTFRIVQPTGVHRIDLHGAPSGSLQTIIINGAVNPDDVRVNTIGDITLSLGGDSQVVITNWDAATTVPSLRVQFDNGTVWREADILSRSTQGTAFSEVLPSSTRHDVYKLSPGRGSDLIQAFQNDAAHTRDDVLALSTSDVTFSLFSVNASMYAPGGGLTDMESGLDIRFNETGEHVRVYDRDFYYAGGGISAYHYHNDFLYSDQVVITMPDGQTLTGVQLSDIIARATQQGSLFDDTLRGTSGDDVLVGGRGDDTYILSDAAFAHGHDVVTHELGDGRDSVICVQDSYTLRLGAGIRPDDVLFNTVGGIAINGTADQINGAAPGLIEFTDGTVWDAAAIKALATVDDGVTRTFHGTAGSDSFAGRGGADDIDGGAGNDVIDGGGGNDILRGGEGSDYLYGGQGRNTLIGGAGNDTFNLSLKFDGFGSDLLLFQRGDGQDLVYGDVGASYELNLGAGILASDISVQGVNDSYWRVMINGASGAVPDQVSGLFLPTRINFADGSAWDAVRIQAALMAGTTLNDVIKGTVGADSITGQQGDDALVGLDGNDSLYGGDGNDNLTGGAGNDYLDGGAGVDNYWYSDPGFGRDVIHADSSDSIFVTLPSLGKADVIVSAQAAATPNSVTFQLKGYDGSVTIDNIKDAQGMHLVVGSDSLTGADLLALATVPKPLTLTGTSGKDTLSGKDGNDTLSGLAGNDTLAGGKGDDLLNGGKGNDTYLFAVGDGHDTIVDNDSTWFNSDLLKIAGAKSNQLWFSRSGNNLDVRVIGTKDQVTIQDWFLGSSHDIEKITAGDGKSLSYSKVQGLVNAMASFAPPAQGQTTLPASTPATITKVIASSWV